MMHKRITILAGVAIAAVMAFGLAVAGVPAVPPDGGAMLTDHGSTLGFIGFGGMLVNAANLENIFNGLKTLFNNGLKAESGNWQKTAMEVPSSGAGEEYVSVSRFPRMRKWIGDKVIRNLKGEKHYVANEDWETTIAVKRNDIKDDKLGIYNNQAMAASESAGELNDIIVDDLKNSAFTKECLDGQYFYDTDHPVDQPDGTVASVSNKITVALSAANLAGAKASYGALREAIMGFKDSEGMPLRLIPDTLEVPAALEAVAKILCSADKLQDNSPNPYKDTAVVEVNPALTSSTAYMLHVTKKKSIKPFLVQMRERPNFVKQIGEENDDVFNRAEYKFGAEARATGLYGFWQLSAGSTGAG